MKIMRNDTHWLVITSPLCTILKSKHYFITLYYFGYYEILVLKFNMVNCSNFNNGVCSILFFFLELHLLANAE